MFNFQDYGRKGKSTPSLKVVKVVNEGPREKKSRDLTTTDPVKIAQ